MTILFSIINEFIVASIDIHSHWSVYFLYVYKVADIQGITEKYL